LVEALLTDPAEPVRRFVDLLDACWEEWFREVWEESRDALAARGRQDRDLALRDGVAAMLRSLLLVPSNYIAPHLFLGEIPGEPLTVIYPAGGRGGAVPTAQQIRHRLEALAAPDRLQVCRAVASESRTAGEVAALWGLHPTQVTRHLRALTRAGLVTAERQGRFVAYRLNEPALRNLGTDLQNLITR